jgi:hypothetical protein
MDSNIRLLHPAHQASPSSCGFVLPTLRLLHVQQMDLPKGVQLGGEASILSQGGEEVFRTPAGSLLAVIGADDRSWVGVLQPQQA